MRLFLILLSLGFLFPCCAKETYIVTCPEDTFTTYFTYVDFYNQKLNAYRSRNFEKFLIYRNRISKRNLYGEIQKPNYASRAYTFNKNEQVHSLHHAYMFSWGSLFDRLKEFEVIDEKGESIGVIQGNFYTDQSAEFSFFDDEQECFAKAVIDNDYSTLAISTPEDQNLFLCKKTFTHDWISDSDPVYFWTIEKSDKTQFDERFLWPFIGFIADVWWKGLTSE